MHAERRYRAVAGRQEGVIDRASLRAAGLSERQIDFRAGSGELVRRHEGIYQVAGAPWTFRARVRAALLAGGASAFVSHWTAAVLTGLRLREPEVIDISLLSGHCGRPDGVRVHRPINVPRGDIWLRNGLRMSIPCRIICELAATAPRADVEYAIQEAAARQLVTPAALRAAAERWAPRSGTVLLRTLLQADGNIEFNRSWAERRLRWIVDQAGLPRPVQNIHILGHLVDAVWPAQRLVVEADGITTHGTPVAFAADRAMDAELVAAGWRVLRFTAAQLRETPMLVATRIAQALALAASVG